MRKDDGIERIYEGNLMNYDGNGAGDSENREKSSNDYEHGWIVGFDVDDDENGPNKRSRH